MLRRSARERVRMDRRSPWWGEHRSRYHFAARLVRGRTALDVACGTGYGQRILADAGAAVVLGIDLSWDALRDAAAAAIDGSAVVQADALALPVKDASAGRIVSFETIEHLHDDESFIKELRRAVAPDGVLVLSTPNALHTMPVDGVPRNPFHVREYTPDELTTLLKRHFDHVELMGQVARPVFPMDPFRRPLGEVVDTERPMRRFWWQIKHRAPFRVKDRLSRLLHNRGFYPGQYDWLFLPERVHDAHVIVATCRP